MSIKYKPPVAIITGAAGLLGQIHAEAILEINGTVVLTDINLIKLSKLKDTLLKKKNYKNKVYVYKMNVTSEKDIIKVSEKVQKKLKKIDILINNAAIDSKVSSKGKLSSTTSFEKFDIKQWRKELDVGLMGYFLCSKIIGSKMINNKNGGIILNIASDLSVIAPNQNLYSRNQKKPVTYSVIKNGIVGLTKYLAAYWGEKNIRVNALSPSGVYNNQDKKFVKKLINLIPLKRMLIKEELKGSIKYLCSEKSSYLNGHNLILDGGRTII